MEKCPYKQGVASLEGVSLVVFYYLSACASEIWSGKEGWSLVGVTLWQRDCCTFI